MTLTARIYCAGRQLPRDTPIYEMLLEEEVCDSHLDELCGGLLHRLLLLVSTSYQTSEEFRTSHRPFADVCLHKGVSLALRFQLYMGGSPSGVGGKFNSAFYWFWVI